MSSYQCPTCGTDWIGEYTIEHRCATCGSVIHGVEPWREDGMPTVTFVPRHVAEDLILPADDTVMLSLCHPGDPSCLQGETGFVRWFFDDIEIPVAGCVMFDLDMAREVIDTAVGYQNIYVHCEAGMSRSAAVAKWLADRRGYNLWLHNNGVGTSAHYNRHVYRTLDAADGRDMAAYYADLERQERMMGE